MRAIHSSFSRCRTVRSSGFFHSAQRARLSCRAGPVPSRIRRLVPPVTRDPPGASRASFQARRRTSSSASVAHCTMWNGSAQRTACGAVGCDHLRDPLRGIGADMGDLRATLLTEGVEELLQRRSVASRRGPHQPPGVVVDHDSEVLVVAFVADLIDPDPRQPGEPVHLGVHVGADPRHDRADGAPGDPHQLGHRRLRARHRQPGHLIVEGAGVSGAVPRPGHRDHRRTMDRTVHSGRVGLEHRLDRAQVQRPPAPSALTGVIARRPSPAAAAPATSPLVRAHVRDQDLLVLVELDVFDDRLLDPQQGAP